MHGCTAVPRPCPCCISGLGPSCTRSLARTPAWQRGKAVSSPPQPGHRLHVLGLPLLSPHAASPQGRPAGRRSVLAMSQPARPAPPPGLLLPRQDLHQQVPGGQGVQAGGRHHQRALRARHEVGLQAVHGAHKVGRGRVVGGQRGRQAGSDAPWEVRRCWWRRTAVAQPGLRRLRALNGLRAGTGGSAAGAGGGCGCARAATQLVGRGPGAGPLLAGAGVSTEHAMTGLH